MDGHPVDDGAGSGTGTTGALTAPAPFPLGGTLLWYYAVCRREVWLMLHAINPDEDDPNLEYGRFLQAQAYRREKKEFQTGGSKLDIVTRAGGELLVVEVKKSSRALESARLQLAHYLLELEERGVRARGELRFPEERRREAVVLDQGLRDRVLAARADIRRLAGEAVPPPPARVQWCGKCAYAEFCWS